MIEFACENCGKKFKVAEEHAGKRTKCPACENALTIPTAGTAPSSPTPSTHAHRQPPGRPAARHPATGQVVPVAAPVATTVEGAEDDETKLTRENIFYCAIGLVAIIAVIIGVRSCGAGDSESVVEVPQVSDARHEEKASGIGALNDLRARMPLTQQAAERSLLANGRTRHTWDFQGKKVMFEVEDDRVMSACVIAGLPEGDKEGQLTGYLFAVAATAKITDQEDMGELRDWVHSSKADRRVFGDIEVSRKVFAPEGGVVLMLTMRPAGP